MTELISTRDAYGPALLECGKKFPEIVALTADLSESTRMTTFKGEFPNRFFNIGIAEADMMGTAAGFASCGKIPFVSTFAIFAAGRAFEQVRNSVAYPKLNVKIGAIHGGITVGPDGASHQGIEDIVLMRSMPNMVVISPADAVETFATVRAAAEYRGPVYIRFGIYPVPVCFDKNTYHFTLGKGIIVKEGADVTIISTGAMLYIALDAGEKLSQEGISAKVIDMHSIKPLDRELIIASAKETGAIVTIEEGTVLGGLGGAVTEVTSAACPVPVKRVGLNDVFGQSGKAEELLQYYGLTADNIIKNVHDVLKMKK
jgi:transketolase